jgi:hypothetical protein
VAAEVETVRDPALKYGLEFGVAFLHDIMRPEDRAVAERLFAAGTVQVCCFLPPLWTGWQSFMPRIRCCVVCVCAHLPEQSPGRAGCTDDLAAHQSTSHLG